jgi:peptide-methionine (S)-S-oxide reductase
VFGFTKSKLPTADEALPGRDTPMPVPEAHFVNGHPLTAPYPDGFQTLVVGMGCFWGAEKAFWSLPGVWVTAVGYAGGVTPNPTYEETCSGMTGHTEAVLVVFDPQVTSTEALLKVFWEGHDPTQGMRQGNDRGTQYRSAVYATTPAQLDQVRRSAEAFGAELAAAGYGSPMPGRSTSPRATTSSTWPRTRAATAAWAAPACRAPWAWPPLTDPVRPDHLG